MHVPGVGVFLCRQETGDERETKQKEETTPSSVAPKRRSQRRLHDREEQ